MFTVNGARCAKVNFLSAKISQLETVIKHHFKQWTNGFFIKMDSQELSYYISATVSKFVEEIEFLFLHL